MANQSKNLSDPIHPGEILQEDFLDELSMSQASLAKALHVPANRINAICNGKRDVTADTAARLAKFFGTTIKFWLNLQICYEIDLLNASGNGHSIDQIVPLTQ